MELSEKHRSTLYEYFAPRLGEEVAEALISQFPKGSADEPITREYLDLRLEALRGDIITRLTTVILGTGGVVIAAISAAVALGS
jgi:hypothetical protein